MKKLILLLVFLESCTRYVPVVKEIEPQSYTFYCGTEPDGIKITGEMKFEKESSAFHFKSGDLKVHGSLDRCLIFERSLDPNDST
jgi:hypothetical protein